MCGRHSGRLYKQNNQHSLIKINRSCKTKSVTCIPRFKKFLTLGCLRRRKRSADEQQMSTLAVCFYRQLFDINNCRVVAFLVFGI